MGLTRKLYGMSLVVVGITTFPISAPTIGGASVSFGTLASGLVIIFT